MLVIVTAAATMRLQIQVFNASTRETAFAGFVRERPDALFVGTGPFLTNRPVGPASEAPRDPRDLWNAPIF